MNIQQAKDEIFRTITIYLSKNEAGFYAMPRERQRPLFLIGPPGIGKTAIMTQIAHEMNLGLVSYTITHHTRQSAIGLPFIEKKDYQGKSYSVTEYTLSEIIASVYNAIEQQNRKEGILFIDEINCVSETLAPAMLELLQNKKFGPHMIPDGWILVTAGNPIEFNSSARNFDMVTMDRIKMIEVDTDFEVWKKYAYNHHFDPTIIYYVQLRPQNLLHVEKTEKGLMFVTPRGWEDLSLAIQLYQKMDYEITIALIEQYIHDQQICLEFYRYYLLYQKYKTEYQIEKIIEGDYKKQINLLKNEKFDQKMAVIESLISVINQGSEEYSTLQQIDQYFFKILQEIKEKTNKSLAVLKKANLRIDKSLANQIMPYFEKVKLQTVLVALREILSDPDVDDLKAQYHFEKTIQKNREYLNLGAIKVKKHLTHILNFMAECFGENHEMSAFLIGLIASRYFLKFIGLNPVEEFYRFNELLLLDQRSQKLNLEISQVLESYNL